MFRLINRKKDWKWQAFGKHPSESEYLRPSSASPLQRAVASWMEQGFDMLPEEIKAAQGMAWNFWMKGPNGKMLCGRLAASSDRYGRSYPLLLIGEGVCGDMQLHWDLLPLAGEQSWSDLYNVTSEAADVPIPLKDRLKAVNAPDVDWKIYQQVREGLRFTKIVNGNPGSSRFLQKLNNIDIYSRKTVFSVPFDDEHIDRYHVAAYKFLALLKARISEEPNMIFMGGTDDTQSLTVLRCSPRAQDFVMLWENGVRGRNGL